MKTFRFSTCQWANPWVRALSYGEHNCSRLGFAPQQDGSRLWARPDLWTLFCPQWPWSRQWPMATNPLKAFGHALVLLKSARRSPPVQAGPGFAWWEQTERLRQRALSIAQNNLPADGHKTVFTKKAKLILHSSRVRQPSFLCLPYKSRRAGVCGTANI